MELLETRIEKEGIVGQGDVLKVGSFLNHQMDAQLMMRCAEEFARIFKDQGINKIVISSDAIRQVLNRPMTPDDAIKAFKQYINSLTVGSKSENIRIILK